MSNLPEFKDIELSDKEWADPLLAVSDYRATEYCFTSLYIWARFFGTRIARWKDWLLIRSDGEEGCANYILTTFSPQEAEISLRFWIQWKRMPPASGDARSSGPLPM